jgi:hypothetical protein
MRKLCVTVLALGGAWWLAAIGAQEADAESSPDLDFLEYLGAWAEDDDEWLAIEEWQKDNGEASGDRAAPEAPEPERNEDDESE